MKLLLGWLLPSMALMSSCAAMAASSHSLPAKTEWTVLVYMNGKNNLEAEAIQDFHEMAAVALSPSVRVVVQLGRPKHHFSRAEGVWSGVYRFLMKKDLSPRPANAVFNLQKQGLNTDMASSETLGDFVRWGIKTYPATKTALIIWSHGNGWRLMLSDDERASVKRDERNIVEKNPASEEMQHLIGRREATLVTAGHRAVSSDADSGNILYNRQIQDTLEMLSREGVRINIIGFDACLMSMIETAFALRKVASYLVASEELEPASGWNYRTILTQLSSDPNIGPPELARTIVRAYKDQYGDDDRTTLSALYLERVEPLAVSLSKLSDYLLTSMSAQRKYIEAARIGMRSFGDWDEPSLQTSIDLKLFLTRLGEKNPDKTIKTKIDRTLSLLEDVFLDNYSAAPVAGEGYGGNGLAIYFPKNKGVFTADRFRDGYLPANTYYPLEFVTSPQTSSWSKLVLKILE